ncbi:MAG: hypothetical protein ACYS8W_10510 [Planctomycetota bacterium]|jgi:hypothetical protein
MHQHHKSPLSPYFRYAAYAALLLIAATLTVPFLACAFAGEKSGEPDKTKTDKGELVAYAESMAVYARRAAELISESKAWIKGFSEFGSRANVASFKDTLNGLVGKIKPLLDVAESVAKAAAGSDWESVNVLRAGHGDELGRLVLLLEGMESNYLIERKRKAEADRALEDIKEYFADTIERVRDGKKILAENVSLASTPKLKLRERKQFQFAGEYLILGGKMLTDEMRKKILELFPDAYKPDTKSKEELPDDPEKEFPDPFTGAGVTSDEPLTSEGELKRLRQLKSAGDYRAVLRLKYDILEPLYSTRGYIAVLHSDNKQFRLEYAKELVEKRHTDLYYMVWRIVKKEAGKTIETTEEWADEVSWRRYDHYPLGTKLIKKRGKLEEDIVMPKKPQSEGRE